MTATSRFALISSKWLIQQKTFAGVIADPTQRASALAEIEAAEAQHEETLQELDRRGFIRNRFPFTAKNGTRVQGGAGWAIKRANGKWENLTNAEAVAELRATEGGAQ